MSKQDKLKLAAVMYFLSHDLMKMGIGFAGYSLASLEDAHRLAREARS